jgi:hypothetical protein
MKVFVISPEKKKTKEPKNQNEILQNIYRYI